MANEPAVEEVRETLSTIVKLLAAQVGSDLKLAERAPLLHRLGVDRATIAVVCDSTPESVSVQVAKARRGGRTTRRGGNGAQAAPEATV